MSSDLSQRHWHPFMMENVLRDGHHFVELSVDLDLYPTDRRKKVESGITARLKAARWVETVRGIDTLIGADTSKVRDKVAKRVRAKNAIGKILDEILSGLEKKYGERWVLTRRQHGIGYSQDENSAGKMLVNTATRRVTDEMLNLFPFGNAHDFSLYYQKLGAPYAAGEERARRAKEPYHAGRPPEPLVADVIRDGIALILDALSLAVARAEQLEAAAVKVADAIRQEKNLRDYANVVAGSIPQPGAEKSCAIAIFSNVNPGELWFDRRDWAIYGIRSYDFYDAVRWLGRALVVKQDAPSSEITQTLKVIEQLTMPTEPPWAGDTFAVMTAQRYINMVKQTGRWPDEDCQLALTSGGAPRF